MKIDEYRLGESLVVGLAENEELPKRNFWVPAIFLAIALGLFATQQEVVISTILVFVAVFLYWVLLPGPVWIFLSANRHQEFIAIYRNSNEKIKEYKVAAKDISSFTMEHERDEFSEQDITAEKGKDLEINLTFCMQGKKTDAKFSLQKLDTRDEMLDFGKRLAKTLGMMGGNIVKNDPKTCIFEFFQEKRDVEKAINVDDINEVANLAKAYQDDNVKKDERLDEIVCEQWDVNKHSFTGTVLEYQPGKELKLQYKRSKWQMVFILLAFVLGFGGIALLIAYGVLENNTKNLGQFIAVGAAVGLIFGTFYNGYKLSSGHYSPVIWEFDFVKRKLQKTKVLDDFSYDLTQGQEIVLYRVKTRHTETTGSGNNKRTRTYYRYNGVVTLHGMADFPIFVLGETGALRENPEDAYEHGLCFADIFHKMLEIPVTFRDVSEKIPSLTQNIPPEKNISSRSDFYYTA